MINCLRNRKWGNTLRRAAWGALAASVCLSALAGCGRPAVTRSPAPSHGTAADSPVVPSLIPAPDGEMQIYFIDVGVGDAALLALPGGKWAMMDTGPADGFAPVNGMLRLLGVKKLEAMFISHPHSDHIGNLGKVLDIVACPVVYTTPVGFGKPTDKLNEAAGSRGAAVHTLQPGQSVSVAGVAFTALGPNGTFTAEENDNSLVLMAEYMGFRVLFAGDQSFEAEAALLKKGYDVGCDVLKVGHHGKEDASSEEFIRSASPRYAVVPSADIPGDEPAPAVLQRLEQSGASVSVVGRTGTLRLSSRSGKPEPVTPATEPAALAITQADAEAEYVEIANPTGGAADLTGWSLHSDKGNQFYCFPDGFALGNGESVRVYSGVPKEQAPAGSLYWTDKNIWHDKKPDEARLLDPYGRTAAMK